MILECRHLSYRYPHTDHPVLDRLSFSIDTPGFHALFGSSGAGKTSLAKIITGRITDFSGAYRNEKKGAFLYTYNLERLPDWSQTGKHLEKITPPNRLELLGTLVTLFGIEDLMTTRFSKLSLGQKNRVNLIRYLVQDFHLLILDESLANVDERTREKIILGVKALFPTQCFLYISHNVSEVARFCDRIFVLRTPEKKPQILSLIGQNRKTDENSDTETVSQTMLEIMNAV